MRSLGSLLTSLYISKSPRRKKKEILQTQYIMDLHDRPVSGPITRSYAHAHNILALAEPGVVGDFKAISQQLESITKMYKKDKETSGQRLLDLNTRFEEFTMDRSDPKGTNHKQHDAHHKTNHNNSESGAFIPWFSNHHAWIFHDLMSSGPVNRSIFPPPTHLWRSKIAGLLLLSGRWCSFLGFEAWSGPTRFDVGRF